MSIPIQDDEIDKSNSEVSVRLLAHSESPDNYQINTVFGEAAIQVRDNDLPTISIQGGTNVIEGNSAQFTVKADIARESDLMIHYQVSDGKK